MTTATPDRPIPDDPWCTCEHNLFQHDIEGGCYVWHCPCESDGTPKWTNFDEDD